VVGCCESANESSGSIKCREFLDKLEELCFMPLVNYNKNVLPEGLNLGGPMSHFGVSMADRTAIVATTVRSVHSKLRAVTIT
jgi:hypothetical protein